ncbi:hypothetical protein [Methanopyrus sp.]
MRVYPCSILSTAWAFLEDRDHPVLLLDVSDLVTSVGSDGVRLREGYAVAVRMEPLDFPPPWTVYGVVTGSDVGLLLPWVLGPIVRECSGIEFRRVARLVDDRLSRGESPEDVEKVVWGSLEPSSPVPLPVVPIVPGVSRRRYPVRWSRYGLPAR